MSTTPDRSIDGFNAALERTRNRLITAQNNRRVITDEDRDDVDAVTAAAIGLGAAIEQLVPDGRNKSLALTALEDALTRANKGIYVDRIGKYEGDALLPATELTPGEAGSERAQTPGDSFYQPPQPKSEPRGPLGDN